MKRIRNRVPIKARMLALTLAMMLFLLSSVIGTTVWAKRPAPPPPSPKYEFNIWVGEDGDDLFLANPEYLTAEGYVDTCGWYWPPKQRTKAGNWDAVLNNFIRPDDDCGDYIVNLPLPPEVPDVIDAIVFSICHAWSSIPAHYSYNNRPYDFWEFYISWGWDMNNPEDTSNIRFLRAYTNWNSEPEGTYHPETTDSADWWEINFNGATWKLEAVNEDSHIYMLDEGTIEQDLWVTIVRGSLIT